MSTTTNIEWTDTTWNPIRGCSRVSEGCRNCYAEKIAYGFSGPGQPYDGLAAEVNGHAAWTGKVEFVGEHLLDPLKWRPVAVDASGSGWITRPRRVFVNSMSDLFHENVPDEWIDRIFAVMALCPQHTFQILTKRPERMLKWFTGLDTNADAVRRAVAACDFATRALGHMLRGDQFDAMESIPRGLPNVWLGVSIENQAAADERIPLLLQTPAAVRFISGEPLLGRVNLDRIVIAPARYPERGQPPVSMSALRGWNGGADRPDRTKLDWVICGGESGPGARPMHPHWARSLRDQCQAAGVPFFFKQWGEWICPTQFGNGMFDPRVHGVICADGRFLRNCDFASEERSKITCRVGKKSAGALLDGREWREFPAMGSMQ